MGLLPGSWIVELSEAAAEASVGNVAEALLIATFAGVPMGGLPGRVAVKFGNNTLNLVQRAQVGQVFLRTNPATGNVDAFEVKSNTDDSTELKNRIDQVLNTLEGRTGVSRVKSVEEIMNGQP